MQDPLSQPGPSSFTPSRSSFGVYHTTPFTPHTTLGQSSRSSQDPSSIPMSGGFGQCLASDFAPHATGFQAYSGGESAYATPSTNVFSTFRSEGTSSVWNAQQANISSMRSHLDEQDDDDDNDGDNEEPYIHRGRPLPRRRVPDRNRRRPSCGTH